MSAKQIVKSVNLRSFLSSDRYFRLALLKCLLATCVALAGPAANAQKADEAKTNFRRAELLLMKGDTAGAIDSFTRAIALRPNWAEAYVQRGHARRMHGELDKAVEDYDKATELDPRTTKNNRMAAQAYTNQGQILALNLHFEEAILDFDKAIKLFSDDERPYYERAQAKLLLEDFSAAVADYNLYITRNTHDVFGRARGIAERGLAKHLLGQDKEGEEDVRQAVKLLGKDASEILDHLAFLEREVIALRQLRAQKKKVIG